MIRAYEKEVSWQAGGLAIAVHLALLGALLISFNWKAAHPVMNVTEVELWDSLPNIQVPTPPPSSPIVEEQPKPEPVVKDAPEIDISLEKKLKELEQKKMADKLKKELVLEQKKQLVALQAESRKDKALSYQQALSTKAAANAGLVDEFRSKIQAKIRGNVNKALCGNGNPELKFDIALLPTGELSGTPKLVKSSGTVACDEAVERAIIASQPLPLPSDASVFSQFRNLKLKFRPND